MGKGMIWLSLGLLSDDESLPWPRTAPRFGAMYDGMSKFFPSSTYVSMIGFSWILPSVFSSILEQQCDLLLRYDHSVVE